MSPAPWNFEPEIVTDTEENGQRKVYPMRPSPIVHPAVGAPICPECQALEMTFFNPECNGCKSELEKMDTHGIGIASIMAVLRQWIPQVQQSIGYLVDEALRMGAHPDDRDGVTDMTLLMFACKAGAAGVGDGTSASRIAQKLIDLGASLKIRCKWTNMAPIHYAAYFDVAPVLNTLLKASKGVDVNSACDEYENGAPLHIAAANLGVSAVKILLKFGADPNLTDDLARRPFDCIPEMHAIDVTLPTDDVEEMITKLQQLLFKEGNHEDLESSACLGFSSLSINAKSITTGRSVMNALGLKIGDRVFVHGDKLGTLQFCGTTEFAGGIWAGVALDEPEGKNDGSIKGVTYFKCLPDHGVFVPPNKMSKVGSSYRDPEEVRLPYAVTASRPPMTRVNHGKVDVSKVAPRIHAAMNVIAEKAKDEIRVGDRVNVDDLVCGDKKRSCYGTVRFVGSVDFVEGDNKWFGVELDEPLGRHDGTVEEVRYFAAPEDHGVFVTDTKLTKLSVQAPRPAKTISDETESCTFSMNYHTLQDSLENATSEDVSENDNRARSKSPRDQPTKHKARPLRRSLSMQHRASKASGESPGKHTKSPGSSNVTTRPTSPSSSHYGPSSIMSTSTNGPSRRQSDASGWQTVGACLPSKFQMKKSLQKKYLEVGTTVICIHTKEMGVVKYVGRADFASGIWLGLELRNPRGKHDGLVGSRRYFSTKANHGIMIRPKLVSVHGINGEDLLKPETEYPF